MSWQAYVDDHLMCEIDGNHLTAAAIVGHDGSVWAQSPNFPQVIPSPLLSPSRFHLLLVSFVGVGVVLDLPTRGSKGPRSRSGAGWDPDLG
jgi:hypothetical protein